MKETDETVWNQESGSNDIEKFEERPNFSEGWDQTEEKEREREKTRRREGREKREVSN